MKKVFVIFAVVALLPFFQGCKKNKAFKEEDGHTSADNQNIQSAADGAVADANSAVSSNNMMAGKTLSPEQIAAATICGASVDTTQRSQGIITVNYDGVTVCNNRKRSGSIKITLQGYANGKRWKDIGAVLQLDYNTFKVTRASDNASVAFSGTHYVTNVTGGNWVLLLFGLQPSLAASVTGTSLQVTFEDGKQAVWNISRKYTYTWANNILTCTGEGTGTQNGISNLENWGTTREGDNFTSQVVTAVVWNTTCGANAPVQGKLVIEVDEKDFALTTTAGVDQSGNVVAPAANTCPYGLKVEWTLKNKTNTKIYKYQ